MLDGSARQWISWGATAALVRPIHGGPAPVALPNPQGGRAAAVALVEVIGEGHGLLGVGCFKYRDVSAILVCEPVGLHASRIEAADYSLWSRTVKAAYGNGPW